MPENRHAGRFCGNCAFWLHQTDHTGACRLHAPTPGEERDEIAHWAHTYHEDYCGEWRAEDAAAPKATLCKTCVYWSFLEGGITPVDYRDQLADWWGEAGHCLRFAPAPAGASGRKAYWRVTHESGSCFDGRALAKA
jgi:hypothetical protein